MSHLTKRSEYVRLQDHNGSNLSTLPVSNDGLTDLAAAINASNQMDVSIAASSATVAVSNGALTALNGCISSDQVAVTGALTVTPEEKEGVAWNAASVSSSDNSASADLRYCPHAGVVINVSDTAGFKLQFSNDDSAWYDSGDSIQLSGASTGCLKFNAPFRYARLQCTSGTGITTTAVFSAKQ